MLFKHNLHYGKFFSPDGEGGGGAGANDGGGEGNDGNAGDGANDNDGESGENDELAGLKSALDKERKAARDAAKQIKTLQAKLDEIENAGKPESEKLSRERDAATQRAEAAEQRLRDANARVAVTEAATKANAISVRAVLKLIEDDLDFNDDGEPTNVDALITQARKDEPQLFRAAAGSADGGKGSNGHKPEPTPGYGRLVSAYETNSTSARR